ncbi:hypothetical protein [Ruegeria sp.]|uniref:hypothetical protein n=1 Tax=Ruegeria sp. TaxID=1879320 RepID=UPI003B59F0CF
MSAARSSNYIALPILLVATALGLYWVWGLLFVWWIVPTILNGQAFLIFEVNRDDDAFLYWAIVCLWALSGLMMIAASLFPQYAHLLT